jgi:uncharacterized membrane protein
MDKLLSLLGVEMLLWGTVLLVMIVLAVAVVRRLRDSIRSDKAGEADLLTNFQEMRREGDINDAEFRNIRAVLGSKRPGEVRNGKDKG